MQARTLFGAGSMLALMCEAFRRQNENGQLWAVPLDDAAGSAQGTTTVTVTGAATAAGTIALYIAGRRVAVPISGATAVNAVATAIATAVQAAGGGTNGVLPVVATVTSAVVTLTNRNGGLSSDIDVRDSFQADEALPAGVAVTYATTAGATDPDIDDALDAVVDERFDVIGHPYGAAASMTSLESALRTRWGPTQQLDGWAVTAFRGTAGAATTYGNARNSQFSCVQGISTAPTSIPGWSGAMAGRCALSAASDPALPFTDLPLEGVLPAPVTERFSHAERETLLSDGIATHTVGRDGVVSLERMVTTYQTAGGGVPDNAWRDSTTPLTLSFLRASLRIRLAKFRRFKLANDGARFGPGQRVATPNTIRADIIGLFRQWEAAGLVESADAFKQGLVVERNATDPNRVDMLLAPTDLVNQVRVLAALISFTLQTSANDEDAEAA